MPFDAIQGQAGAIGTLQRILRSGRVHHALRFEGPEGVGKEMAALAFAQALVCTGGNPLGCGQCSACRRAVQFCEGPPAVPLHPDVIFIERGLYPPESLGRNRQETQDISVDQIRTVVLERTCFPPHEGRARVFIIRHAEELSTSAANALLKTLEEPGQGTHFVVLVSHPSELPNTILSRTLRVRFSPLPEPVLTRILVEKGIEQARAAEAAALSGGSASVALSLLDAEACKERDSFIEAALEALASPDMVAGLKLAESRSRDKPLLRTNLEALAAHFARQARADAQEGDRRACSGALRYQIVLQALRQIDRNASPALLVESMLMRLRAEAG